MVNIIIYKDYDLIEELERIITKSYEPDDWIKKTKFLRYEITKVIEVLKKSAEVMIKNEK